MKSRAGAPCLVLGAGISGLLAARELTAAGASVVVLEKSRGVGGRMATRRLDSGTCDHGAQFFTVKSPDFRPVVEAAAAQGAAALWCDGFPDGAGALPPARHPRLRGVPGMTALPKILSEGLDIRLSWKAVRVAFGGGRWTATNDAGETLGADALFLAAPLPQSLALLDAGGVRLEADDDAALRACAYHPCFSLMARLSGDSAVPEPGGVYPCLSAGHEPLAWIADNRRKGVSPQAATLTILGGREFSRAHFDAEPAAVEDLMLRAAAPWLGSEVVERRLHRWRYSEPVRPFADAFRRAAGAAPLYFIGDAFGGSRVEGAALSGLRAARHHLGERSAAA
jgi:predicted NAD/FAD-dependent oxidoreductase